jgi:hypothetical protein
VLIERSAGRVTGVKPKVKAWGGGDGRRGLWHLDCTREGLKKGQNDLHVHVTRVTGTTCPAPKFVPWLACGPPSFPARQSPADWPGQSGGGGARRRRPSMPRYRVVLYVLSSFRSIRHEHVAL